MVLFCTARTIIHQWKVLQNVEKYIAQKILKLIAGDQIKILIQLVAREVKKEATPYTLCV